MGDIQMSVVLVQGSRGSGKTTCLLHNIEGNTVFITPNVSMAREARRSFIQESISSISKLQGDTLILRDGSILVFCSIHEAVLNMGYLDVNRVMVDNAEMLSLHSIISLYARIPYTMSQDRQMWLSFTPYPVSSQEINRSILAVGQHLPIKGMIKLDSRIENPRPNFDMGLSWRILDPENDYKLLLKW
jgi:hypothetical protein